MFKAILYLLFFSYTSLLLKPVLPLVADTAAHLFWYTNHMATVHMENGQYHLHFETLKNAGNTTDEKNNPSVKVPFLGGEHILTTATCLNSPLPILDIPLMCYSVFFPIHPSSCQYQPPELI